MREFIESVKGLLTENGVLSFNAAMPAVKAANYLFDNVVVAARAPDQVADAFFFDGIQVTNEAFINQYIASRRELLKLSMHKMHPDQLDKSLPPHGFILVGKEVIDVALENITEQRDDLPATEYFFTATTMFGTTEDSRYWPMLNGAIPTSSLLK